MAGVSARARLGMRLTGVNVDLLVLLLFAGSVTAAGWLLLAYLLSSPHGRRRRR